MNKLSRNLSILTIVAASAAHGALPGQTVLAQDARRPQSSVTLQYGELPNFHQVNEHLYRGAQPRKAGMKRLAELGVKTVVNLRGEADLSRKEEADAKAAGLRYFSVPMPGLSRPTDQQVARVMAIVDAPENWPVFVHCQHGSDRTGTIVACYHISHDGWTADRSIAEAKQYGMSWVEFGMRGYITSYHPAASRDAASTTAASTAAVSGSKAVASKKDQTDSQQRVAAGTAVSNKPQ